LRGPGDMAVKYLRRAADLLRPAGASSLRAAALNNLGEVYFGLGNLSAAEECYTEARDICREIGGYVWGSTLHNLGLVYLRQHRLADAIACFDEALPKHRASGLLFGEAITLKRLGEAQQQTGAVAAARASLTRSLQLFEQIGERAEAAETAALLAALPDEDA